MDPEVKIIENFMSVEDCNNFIDTYKDKLERSTTTKYSNNENKNVINERRTSSTYIIPDTDPLSYYFRSKIADSLQIDIRKMEHAQLTRYVKGEFFKRHYDFLMDGTNQREYSIIIYLNDLEEHDGGKTEFPLCGIAILPKAGRAIYFKNCDSDGNRITKSIHSGGEILTDTVKYVLTIFVRQRPH